MPKLQVLQHPHDLLREVAEEVTDINDDIRRLAKDMQRALIDENGIGLAAPQVGKSIRLIVLLSEPHVYGIVHALANPVITYRRGTQESWEACLSVPDISGVVKRNMEVKVEGINVHTGLETLMELRGLDAACAQHEIDHLDGVLFIDRMRNG